MDISSFQAALQQYLVGRSSGLQQSFSLPVKASLQTLKRNQTDVDAVMVEFRHALAELQAQYEKKLDPLLETRSEIISGAVEPSEQDWAAAKSELNTVEELPEEQSEEEKPEEDHKSGIPSFWTIALRNVPLVENLIEDHDVPALDALKDIRYHTLTGEDLGFKIEFIFGDNPLFDSCTLTKTFYMSEDADDILLKIEATSDIPWKEGKKEEILSKDTFFKMFTEIPNVEDESPGLQEEMEVQYETGQVLKTVCLKAVSAFLGELDEFGGLEMFGDDDEDDEDYEEDSDEESDEEGGAQEQCKQQ
ncbi:hypothetical protein P9112_003401 [Eukaryota sp. TZLM1-RC]